MKLFLMVVCGLFSGLLFGADPAKKTPEKKDYFETQNEERPWNAWKKLIVDNKDGTATVSNERTWHEWWYWFKGMRIHQYAGAIIDGKKDDPAVSFADTFKGHEQFRQDREQGKWLSFCEKKTAALLNTSTDKLTTYQLEEWYDCCGAPIRWYAQDMPQKFGEQIEFVNSVENVLVAMKALDIKIKAVKQDKQ
jgi:hypothetical protein